MATLQRLLHAVPLDNNLYRLARLSGHAFDFGVEVNVDAFILKESPKAFAHIQVFARHKMLIAIDHRYAAAEATHCLRQLNPDVSASDHQQVVWDLVEFESFNVRERLSLGEAGSRSQRRVRAGADDDVGPAQPPGR